jgi:hypothetical protein
VTACWFLAGPDAVAGASSNKGDVYVTCSSVSVIWAGACIVQKLGDSTRLSVIDRDRHYSVPQRRAAIQWEDRPSCAGSVTNCLITADGTPATLRSPIAASAARADLYTATTTCFIAAVPFLMEKERSRPAPGSPQARPGQPPGSEQKSTRRQSGGTRLPGAVLVDQADQHMPYSHTRPPSRRPRKPSRGSGRIYPSSKRCAPRPCTIQG